MKNANSNVTLLSADTCLTSQQENIRTPLLKSHLINSLNSINFHDGTIVLQFKHLKYQSVVTLSATPQLCDDETLECTWSAPVNVAQKLKSYVFDGFYISDGLKKIQVDAEMLEMTDQGARLILPKICYEVESRTIKRHQCKGISAQISQNGAILEGLLVNFSALFFSIAIQADVPFRRQQLDIANPVNIVLRDESGFLFSGRCTIIRQTGNRHGNTLVFSPVNNKIQRFKPKEVRSERLKLSPLPNIVFPHPFTRKKTSLALLDISGGGFAVEEDQDYAVLLPGMIIRDVELEFLQGFAVKCTTQVVYRIPTENCVKCGLAILDMDVRDHIKLSSLLHQAMNKHSYISTTNVDLDALFDFFFETGFIYPGKYIHIKDQKEQFKALYKKLYTENPEIARFVIYQERGRIYGHVAMFRFYQSTWLMHHHAAVKSSRHKAGLIVMEHILQYINEFHNISSSRMNYIASYFRPNNRFANRVFGGIARNLDDPRKSSLDDFAYFHYQPARASGGLPFPWTLEPAGADDLHIMQDWYNEISGGLLIDALDLGPGSDQMDEEISREYKNAGFHRDRHLHALKKDDELMAVLVVNNADLGLNMSDLTNCIQVLILDQKQLRKDMLLQGLSLLSKYYTHKDIPVLLYPSSFANNRAIPCEKIYELGILDLNYMSSCLKFIKSLTTLKRPKKVRNLA